MPDSFEIKHFIESFQHIYHTVEVRAALKEELDHWHAVSVVFHVRIQTSGEVCEEFKNRETTYGTVVSERFRIVQVCHSFDKFNEIATNLQDGMLELDNVRIKFSGNVTFLNNRGYISNSWDNFLRDPLNWPILKTQTQLRTDANLGQLLESDSRIFRDSEVAGYSDPYSAINQLLGINVNNGSIPYLWFGCDVPARIDNLKIRRNSLGRLSLQLQVFAPQNIFDLFCNVRLLKRGQEQKILFQKVLPLSPSTLKGDPQLWEGVYDFTTDVILGDSVTLELTQKDVGRLHTMKFDPLELLPIEERNPLFVVLKRFCGADRIKELLEDPELTTPIQNVSLSNKGKLYEVSVQWLLSSMGFQAVWLHGFEKLEIDKHDYGSVDCIAFHSLANTLLLVNCSIAPPNQSELGRQKELQHRLAIDLFQNTTVRLFSVVFTSAHRKGEVIEDPLGYDVRIIFREDIANLLKLIEIGKEIKFLEHVINPLFWPIEEGV